MLELVEGGNLSRLPGGLPCAPREAAEVLLTLADAVEYAHRAGVIHRDLKPANILLGSALSGDSGDHDSSEGNVLAPFLKISDFGLAKIQSEAELRTDDATRSGAMIGTPAYVAPEQANGTAPLGPPADIYSLGVMLYELLTGRPPFQAPTAVETLVQAAHQEPVPPRRLLSNIPRDLQTICLKCLEKRPLRRYPSAAALAGDLQRFLRGESIQARPPSLIEQLGRWIRRHPGVSALLATIGLILTTVAIGATAIASHFHDLGEYQRKLVGEKQQLVVQKESQRQKAVEAENRESLLRVSAEQKAEEYRHNLYFAQMNQIGRSLLSPSGGSQFDTLLSSWKPDRWSLNQPDLRRWEWYYFNGLCHSELASHVGHRGPVSDVAWNPDGTRLASAGHDGLVWIWNTRDWDHALPLSFHQRVESVSWNSTGTLLAAVGQDGSIRVWDATTGSLRKVLTGHGDHTWSVAFSPDGERIACASEDCMVRVWRLTGDSEPLVLKGHTRSVHGVAWSPTTPQLASAAMDASVRIWDVDSGTQTRLLSGHLNGVARVAWSPDGSRLVSASFDRTCKVWNMLDMTEVCTLVGHAEPVNCAVWSPDGTQIATASRDETIKIWNPASETAVTTFVGHSGHVHSVSWHRNGLLASANHDASVKIWDVARKSDRSVLRGHSADVNALAWSSDGRTLASTGLDLMVRVWNAAGAETNRFAGHTEMIHSVCWEPRGRRIATASSDQTVRIWNTETQELERTFTGHSGEVFGVAWSPDSTRIASCGEDRTICIWDPLNGRPMRTLVGHEQLVRAVAWSPDGRKLASASWDRSIRVWDPHVGAQLLNMSGHSAEILSVAWSPDGRWIVSASGDQTSRIWDASTGELRHILRGHTGQLSSVGWSPDGSRVATACGDRTVKLWDVDSGQEVTSLTDMDSEVLAVAWNPHYPILATGWGDHCVRLLDASPGQAASKEPIYLPLLNDRLQSNPSDYMAWREKCEILAGSRDVKEAAATAQRYLELNPTHAWILAGVWISGPYSDKLEVPCAAESDAGVGTTGQPQIDTIQLLPPRWHRVPLNAAGLINFGGHYEAAEHISAYALMRVYAMKRCPVSLKIGSDDQARLWLNGRQIYESLQVRAAVPDADSVSVDLEQGWNTLLVRVINVTGDHALYLRIAEPTTSASKTESARSNRGRRMGV